MSGTPGRTAALRSQYRELAVEWGGAQDDPPVANQILRRHHDLAKRMRETPEGRQAIEELLDDAVTVVRLAAATDSLAWQSSRGVAALEEIEQEGSLYAVDAKWTLRSYRSGKLNLDW
jgi:hypothetical protein